jgi:uracil-DNA glycosylase
MRQSSAAAVAAEWATLTLQWGSMVSKVQPTDTFIALVEAVRQCRLCESHLPLGPRPVLQIDPRATILIAGQAPGRRVHASGIPFDDPSGERLRDWMGVTRDTFYDAAQIALVPMGFCYPGTGKSGDLPPRPECARTWRAQLLDALPNVALTLVIGQYAHAWHLPASRVSVTATVQRWREHAPELVPLPHPSPRNNLWLRRNPWFVEELLPELKALVRHALSG